VSLSVAHDLNAPLRRIQGFAQALAEDYGSRLDDRGRHYLERIQAATKMMQTLVDGLLSLASYGSHRMERTKVDLSKLVQDKVKELRDREPARKLEVSIASPLATYGDQRLIQVVIENLLENAWKFSANRAVTRIEFGARTRDGLSDGIVYFVRDNGIGFRTADAGSLFRIFGRLHSHLDIPGHGIGLATVKQIIGAHGGQIWAEGRENEGATFYFTLPVRQETGSKQCPPDEAPGCLAPGTEVAANLRNGRP
jgi:light-regulated signal transduction histidine kinase (bacteriophytochrome)